MKIGSNILSLLADSFYWDYCDTYGEPGYDDPEGGVILGDFWCRTCPKVKEDGTSNHHSVEKHYPHIFQALVDQGWEFEWADEWVIDHERSKCYRVEPNSYTWKSSILWTDGDFLTPDDPLEDWLEEVMNDSHRCLSDGIWSESQFEELGFHKWNTDDVYRNGWYDREDRPEDVENSIRRKYECRDVDIFFVHDYSSQFEIGFSAWYKVKEVNEDQEAS
jgi:hypothetical protein